MRERGRGRGGIIFVASIAGYNCVPYMANYMATKSYLISLGEALHHEFKNHGVDVLVLSPGLMNTDPDNTREPDVGLEKPDSDSMGKAMPVAPVVVETFKNLGRKITVFPGTQSKIMAFLFKHVLTRGMVANIFGNMGIENISKEML
jgi:hypothetical protein